MTTRSAASLVVVAVLLCTLAVGPFSSGIADGQSATFVNNSPTNDRGDVIPITVHTDHGGTVNIGSTANGFWVQVNVTSGTTTLDLNTYRAADPNRTVTVGKGGIKGTPNVRIPSEKGPLQSGVYDMNVTVDGVTQDMGSFTVKKHTLRAARTGVLPEKTDVSEFETADDLRAAVSPTENGTVAKDDQLVLAVNVSGMSGFLDKSMLDGSGEDVRIHFRETNAKRNTVANEFDGDEAKRLLIDDENDVLYLMLGTDAHGIEAGDSYEATFEIGEDNPLVAHIETASTNFTVEKRRVSLDHTGDVLVVDGKTRVGGTTNLAPGTTINISAHDKGSGAFFWSKTATVTEDRTFGATFDFSGLESGRTFTVELRDQEQTLPGVVASSSEESTTTTSTTTTTITTSTTTTTTSTTTTTITTNTSTTTTNTTTTETVPPVTTQQPITAQSVSKDGLPGFGIPVALVALAAAAVLVVRRAQA